MSESDEFVWLTPLSVKSCRGFALGSVERFAMRYTEGDRSTLLDTEAGFSDEQHIMHVTVSTVTAWAPPHEQEPIDDHKRLEIADNVRRALRFMNSVPRIL